MGTFESKCMLGSPQLPRVCILGQQWANQIRMIYARDGNEAADENGPQGGTHIDDCGHADLCVGKRTNGRKAIKGRYM